MKEERKVSRKVRKRKIEESMYERLENIKEHFEDVVVKRGFDFYELDGDLIGDKSASFKSEFMKLGGTEIIFTLTGDRNSFLFRCDLKAFTAEGSTGTLWSNTYRVDEVYEVDSVLEHHERLLRDDFPTISY